MKYKVTFGCTIDVEADDETQAVEEAGKILGMKLSHMKPTEVMEAYFGENKVYLPDNDYGIAEGNYDLGGLVGLLRTYKAKPEAIQFIADMLEQ